MKPVLYLDVDGVLWDVDRDAGTIATEDRIKAANGLVEFMDWVLEHMEVRWCTTWALSGEMDESHLARLERYTGIDVEIWRKVRPAGHHFDTKVGAIAWEEHLAGRPFAWVEDGLFSAELHKLADHGFLDCYIHTDVFEDPDALVHALRALKRRFG